MYDSTHLKGNERSGESRPLLEKKETSHDEAEELLRNMKLISHNIANVKIMPFNSEFRALLHS